MGVANLGLPPTAGNTCSTHTSPLRGKGVFVSDSGLGFLGLGRWLNRAADSFGSHYRNFIVEILGHMW